MTRPSAYPMAPALRARPAPTLPVSQMVLGQPVDTVAALLPRLFNLCRAAQGVAVRAALGLTQDPDWQGALRQEILREHMVKLCLKWPALMSLPAVALPRDWMDGSDSARHALFGARGHMPDHPADLPAFLAQNRGISPVLRAISWVFQPGDACRSTLPQATPDILFRDGAQENSVAGRRADHPVLRSVAERQGRGPLWSALGVAYELDALLSGDAPRLWTTPQGVAIDAARGLYGISARVQDGRVTDFTRITPTDHLTAPNGALDQSLARLPADRARALAPLLIAILDPCTPIAFDPVPAPSKEPEHA